jgi:hypothetical protein
MNEAFDKFVGAIRSSKTDRGVAMESRANMDTRLSRVGLEAYAALGRKPVGGKQGIEDARRVLGFGPEFVGVTVAIGPSTMPAYTPMRFMTDSRTIEINPDFRFNRAEAARYAVEEMLHAVDVLKNGRSIAASSPRFLEGGDIREELQRHVDSEGIYADFLAYPFNRQSGFHDEFGDGRMAAEAFAVGGTLYFGDGERTRQSLPATYEAFHELFGSTVREGAERLQGKLWDSPTAGMLPDRVASVSDRRAGRLGGEGGRDRTNPGLVSLRQALARSFRATRYGGGVGESLEARVIAAPTFGLEQLLAISESPLTSKPLPSRSGDRAASNGSDAPPPS